MAEGKRGEYEKRVDTSANIISQALDRGLHVEEEVTNSWNVKGHCPKKGQTNGMVQQSSMKVVRVNGKGWWHVSRKANEGSRLCRKHQSEMDYRGGSREIGRKMGCVVEVQK